MRIASPTLALLASLACTSEQAPAPKPAPPAKVDSPKVSVNEKAPPTPTPEGPEYYIGVASQSGVPHCPEGGERQWLGLAPTIGFIGIAGPGSELVPSLLGRPVLVRGSSGPAPAPRPSTVVPTPCPPMQMRSDWVETPRGIVVDDGDRPSIDFFQTTSLRPLDELVVRREGSEIVVELRNPLPFAIRELGLGMRYEGCQGKPGSRSIERDAAPLGVGETRIERFPIFAEQLDEGADAGDRKHHAADSLELFGDLSGEAKVFLDLDVALAAMGAEVECPE
ncbi:hypothetical protein ACNOYE_35060 [Nannocystaceae bacterium ST9]